jgi:hypothetical protein
MDIDSTTGTFLKIEDRKPIHPVIVG